ncbi:MAG TPA: tetratricopeptide repeat protein, partial [Labilithrix sp.]
MLHDDAVVARLLRTHALTKGAREGDILAVVEAYEIAGHPERAVSFLRERIAKFHGEPRTRVILALLLSRSQETKAAVAAWRDYEAAFGFDSLATDDALHYARDVSRTGDVDGAYALLQKMRARAPDDAKEYWTDLATLAWERDDDETALQAYEKVYALDKKALHVALRIATILVDGQRLDDATPIALADYKRTDDPAGLLLVAHAREQKGEWPKLRELMNAADAEKGALAKREDWLLLEGDTLKQLGDRKGAVERYARALAVAPGSVEAKTSILWTSLENPDPRPLRDAVQAFTAASRDEPTLWAPMALALVRLDRSNEALPWFERHLKAHPDDAHILLDYADALAKMGRETTAADLRRLAVVRMRADAVSALHSKTRTEEDALVLGSTTTVIRERSGVTQGDRWLAAIARGNPRLVGQEETAVDTFLATDRPDFARRVMGRLGAQAERGPMLRHRLALAIEDDDRPKILQLLDAGGDITSAERAHALVALGQERAAIGAIGDALAKNDEPAEIAPLREELVRIGPAHQPQVRAGATYVHVTGLDVAGPMAGAAHDLWHGRMLYSAYGVRMTERADLINLPDPRYEADGGATYRQTTERGVTEVGAGFNYQKGTPVGRAELFDERLLTSRLGITTDVRFSDRIEDTSFLRVGAIRHHATFGARYDWPRFYATGQIEGREDQTRKYKHLAWD